MQNNTTKRYTEVTMSNKKQSSIDWLIGQLKAQYDIDIERLTVTDKSKAMHKEEIIDSFGVGCQVEASRLIGYHKMAEQYYNEIYGGNNEKNN
jgi:hypothetical protein